MKTKTIEIKAETLTEFLDAIASIFDGKMVPEEKEVKKTECSTSISNPYNLYVERIANRMKWKPEKVANFLSNLWKMCPSAAFSVLLREIAIVLDEKYPGHINECEKLFVVSLMDGRIHEVPRAYIKNFRNFAAFRTMEDAKTACKILRNDLKEMFEFCGK